MPIRWHLAALLKAKGWSAYRLAHETGLTESAAYKLARKTDAERVEAPTLELLCKALGCQPGDLLTYVPDRKR